MNLGLQDELGRSLLLAPPSDRASANRLNLGQGTTSATPSPIPYLHKIQSFKEVKVQCLASVTSVRAITVNNSNVLLEIP